MYNYWRKFKLMPWQWGFTPKPCIEHIKAIEAMDFMVNDAERMERELKGDK
jgi:hypothetical protein